MRLSPPKAASESFSRGILEKVYQRRHKKYNSTSCKKACGGFFLFCFFRFCFLLLYNFLATVCERETIFLLYKCRLLTFLLGFFQNKDTVPDTTSHWALSKVLNGIPHVIPSVCVKDIIPHCVYVVVCACICIHPPVSKRIIYLLPNSNRSDNRESKLTFVIIMLQVWRCNSNINSNLPAKLCQHNRLGGKEKKNITFGKENSSIVTSVFRPVNYSERIRSHVAVTLFSLANHTEANKCKPCGKG